MTYYPPRYLFRRCEILKRIRPGNGFLEIGAGNLMLSQTLLRFFNQGTLIDYNEKINLLFQSLSPSIQDRLEIIIADFTAYQFNDSFDCIIACEVLEHVRDDYGFIHKAHQLLNNEGQLVLSVPSRKKFWSVHDEIVGHLRRYEKNEINQLLRANNFVNIEIASYGYPFVNLLRYASIMLAGYSHREKRQWDQKRQSQESGIVQTGRLADSAGFLLNPITCRPLCTFSSLFNHTDLSNGYLITADKRL